jgi:hypothetical protein
MGNERKAGESVRSEEEIRAEIARLRERRDQLDADRKIPVRLRSLAVAYAERKMEALLWVLYEDNATPFTTDLEVTHHDETDG